MHPRTRARLLGAQGPVIGFLFLRPPPRVSCRRATVAFATRVALVHTRVGGKGEVFRVIHVPSLPTQLRAPVRRRRPRASCFLSPP
jgi:hypothetical protein